MACLGGTCGVDHYAYCSAYIGNYWSYGGGLVKPYDDDDARITGDGYRG